MEVPTPAVREALLTRLCARAACPLVEVSLKGLPDGALLDVIVAQPQYKARSPRAVLVLTDLEETTDAAAESHLPVFMRFNPSDLLARGPPATCSRTAALLKLRLVAPDFCHYLSTLVRRKSEVAAVAESGRGGRSDLSPSGWLELSEPTAWAVARSRSVGGAGRSIRRAINWRSCATAGVRGWAPEAILLEGPSTACRLGRQGWARRAGAA
ncbi:MAG: hypothetical protein U0324_32725 [Polyangiales bacterium]